MSTTSQPNPQTELNKLLEIIGKIAKISADGDYIFRGEPQCYCKASSALYRALKKAGLLDEHDIETFQRQELEYVKEYRYTEKTDDTEILTELQHFGGKTNLIDFTTDYRIALFFACNLFPFEDGRVILQDRNGTTKGWVKEPQNLDKGSRPDVQKSIFVQPPKGFIEVDKEIVIPKALKKYMLKYLEKEFNTSSKTIYPDLHGFVGSQEDRWKVYEEISQGTNYLKKGQSMDVPQERSKNYRKAIRHFSNAIVNSMQLDEGLALAYNSRGCAYFAEHERDHPACNLENAIADFSKAIDLKPKYDEAYNRRGGAYLSKVDIKNAIADFNKAIDLNPEFVEAYHNRGIAYFNKGEFALAIQDYTKALQLKPDNPCIYYDKGIAWLHLQKWEKAKVNLTRAKDMGVDIVNLFHNFCESLANWEKKIGVKLPKDLTAMLRKQ